METYVDNEIAVENLTKMAKQTGCAVTSQKLDEGKYSVQIMVYRSGKNRKNAAESVNCGPTPASHKVVVIRSSVMGEGDPELGKSADQRVYLCLVPAGGSSENHIVLQWRCLSDL